MNATTHKPLTIGRVAREAGVGVETVRFYEREGLLPRPPRRDAGYRQYGDDAVARLRFIRRAKELGFTLKEVSELLELRVAHGSGAGDVKRRTAAKIEDVDRRIEALRRIRETLAELERACSGEGDLGSCPILHALDHDGRRPAAGYAAGHTTKTKGVRRRR